MSRLANIAILMGALCITGTAPAVAEQSQAYFTQGVQICRDFGNDGFFVVDRLEEKGWVKRHDDYYETDVMYTPGKSVWVIPPEEGASMPASCVVISGAVTIMQAEASVNLVVSNSNDKHQILSNQGCTEIDFFGSQKIRIWSDGQDDFCNDPNSARVEVITLVDPNVGQ
ncbi:MULTISPECIES: hypothetical protein [Cohaesibacter]|uniref:hypothetical protein n=1 Tax=Cohaesibacter TaxID=655352 RepID=UPI0010FD24C7|nr:MULTISPECIES: hypothetical protein [Cohaesibacter]TLP43887.1 hypothetical protein FDK21_16880 [Cohaesibacter sp. CAU 1516]